MTIATENQALKRWDTLPEDLREALYSEANSDFLWKTCNDENIPDKKIYQIAKVTGYVLLGFLHPEDVAQSIVELLKIDSQTAKSIEEALNKRIFTPLRADIDKVYSPLSKAEATSTESSPKVLRDVNVSLKPAIMPVTNAPTAPAPKPSTLSDVGWSKSSPTGPGIKLTPSPSTPAVPQVAAIPVPIPSSVPPAEPAPMILHEDTTFKAAEKNAGFTLSRPGSGAEVHMSQGATQAPTRPAVLEFGGVKAPAAPNKPSATPSSNAVHYTELKLSLSSVPTADTGPRSVSQIGASVPVPTPPMPNSNAATVPRPPQIQQPLQPPKPPQISQNPQKDKPIVKDFL